MALSAISRRADTQSGRYCIRGTRVPVVTIKSFHAAGCGVADIHKEYPHLTLDQIAAALAWRP